MSTDPPGQAAPVARASASPSAVDLCSCLHISTIFDMPPPMFSPVSGVHLAGHRAPSAAKQSHVSRAWCA